MPALLLTKADLLRLHQELYALRTALIQAGAPTEAFAEYDALGTTPLRIDHPREAHHKAVLALTRGLRGLVEHRGSEPAPWRFGA